MAFTSLETISEMTVLSFICLAALIGNVSLFVIVHKNPNLRTTTNMFILNLAAADVLVSVLSMPVTMVTIVKERWVFGHTACVVLGYLTILSFIASVMSLGMIAINRYFYIVKWNTYTNTFPKKRALLSHSIHLGGFDITCFPSTLRLGRISLHSWKILLLRSLALKCLLHVFYDYSLLFWSSLDDGILLLQHYYFY